TNNRHAIKRKNRTWMVVDYSAGLCVIDLHNDAKAFDFTIKDDSAAEE
ncbi:6400_t:CDS:1, partial [Funneliformis caledonium]